MIELRTAQNYTVPVNWIGVSDFDGSLRFETPETDLPCVTVSARTGEGLDALERVIRGLFPLPQVPAGEILTNLRQYEAVSRAAEAMSAALDALRQGLTPDLVLTEAEGAMQALGELNGRSVRENVTERIFSRFCVGK